MAARSRARYFMRGEICSTIPLGYPATWRKGVSMGVREGNLSHGLMMRGSWERSLALPKPPTLPPRPRPQNKLHISASRANKDCADRSGACGDRQTKTRPRAMGSLEKQKRSTVRRHARASLFRLHGSTPSIGWRSAPVLLGESFSPDSSLPRGARELCSTAPCS
ncbi:predicted protein [Coccidioides posadasii str. Silveira]|uniref:Predicted protein n=2 Tax=Coccidioides posadasii TaxID=199306 RepID=E9DDD3_COCPS|nr:predicted protein [Coccidioides posadasii str. Silveira]KMM65652.1 hypothetical protein CPAG_01998 [Coccidioides posadasii RMSCC 3488]